MFKFIEKISDTYEKIEKILWYIINIGENTDNIIVRLSALSEERLVKEELENEIKTEIKDQLLAAIAKKWNTCSKQEIIALINIIKTNK